MTNKFFSKQHTNLLLEFLNSLSTSSHEDDFALLLSKKLKKYNGVFEQKMLKNILFSYETLNDKKPIILIDSHMDQIGFVVSKILENGSIQAQELGGVDPNTLLTQRLILVNHKKQTFPGTVSIVPPHFRKKINYSFKKVTDLYFDFGFTSKQDAINHHIAKDDPIHFNVPAQLMINNQILSQGVDNKIGCFINFLLIDFFAKLYKKLPFQLLFSFSTQEEVGLRSAKTLNLKNLLIDLALVLDVSPVVEKFKNDTPSIGKGMLLRLMDAGHIVNHNILNLQRDILQENKMSFQPYISPGGTNAAVISLLKQGILTMPITLPGRNLHTASSIFNLQDVSDTFAFCKKLLQSLTLQKIESLKYIY